jgi:hypothetical protein
MRCHEGMKTIFTATLLALSAISAAAQTTYYGPGGDYLGQGTRHRNTGTFYDASGNFVGSSVTIGGSTSFYGRDGAFQGTLSRTGDTTNFYEPHWPLSGFGVYNAPAVAR